MAEKEIEVKIKYLHPAWDEAKLAYATSFSAGVDLRACLETRQACIHPGQRRAVQAGLAIEIVTPGIAGFIFSRSGLGTKEGLVVSQGVGVIDPDYRGEIIVSLMNTSQTAKTIFSGQRIAQLLFMPAYQARLVPVAELNPSGRGHGGFGHTGSE